MVVENIPLDAYIQELSIHPNLLKQSLDWRLDHLLDVDVPLDTKEQWIYEIKEIIDEIVGRSVIKI